MKVNVCDTDKAENESIYNMEGLTMQCKVVNQNRLVFSLCTGDLFSTSVKVTR